MADQDIGRAVPLATEDGAACAGFLFDSGKRDCVVIVQHPREFITHHYLTPHVLSAGASFFIQAPRSIGLDLRLEHEQSLYEVAAGVRFLREQGYRRVVLLGNSGGASLHAYYNEQSLAAAANRIERSPTGRPTGFQTADFPQVDGLVLVAPHPGQGLLLMNGIDPSLVDESDPFSCDESLDPFSEGNGFREPPQSACYAPDFVKHYRAAQRARVARLDQWAKDVLAQRATARRSLKAGDRARSVRIAAAHTPIRTVWRTDADLRCFDLSLDPSARGYGSLWGRDPIKSNYGSLGFGRLVTAESWLSTWSGLSSLAALPRTLPALEQPCLFLTYASDNSVFPEEASGLFAAIGGAKKRWLELPGNHHGRVGDARTGQEAAGDAVRGWLGDQGFLS